MSDTNTINPTTQSSEDVTTFVVPPPFDESSPGDCILRTPDGVEFRVVRQILSLASPIMNDMFNMPQGDERAKLPVVDVTEDADTVLQLLLLLYPTAVNKSLEVKTAIKLAEAYKKYCIPNARLLQAVEYLYASGDILKKSTLELFMLAHELGLESEASKASRFTHRIPTTELLTELPLELLKKVLDLRERREKHLDHLIAALEPRRWICDRHKQLETAFFSEIVALKENVRLSIQEPYPEEVEASAFFGQVARYSPRECNSGHYSTSYVCFSNVGWTYVDQSLKKALKDFPQCI